MSTQTMRDRIKHWAESARHNEDKLVKVRLTFGAFKGGEREAYTYARAIMTGFYAMRAWERRKVAKRQKALSLPMPAATPYEDVYCKVFKHATLAAHEVHFIRMDTPEFEGMFEVIGADPLPTVDELEGINLEDLIRQDTEGGLSANARRTRERFAALPEDLANLAPSEAEAKLAKLVNDTNQFGESNDAAGVGIEDMWAGEDEDEEGA